MSNKNAFEPAYGFVDNRSSSYGDNEIHYGLTKRELAAFMAMQGFAAAPEKGNFKTIEDGIKMMAELSVIAADAILFELSKPTT